ncbi:alpha-1,4-glucan--maltose-1-phosphate maltosyltransferase [Nannocystis bainbridge]|uniref:alpha-1,4-glucan--maltose-1-phosphate maltosyltransferase n=1 Tax=Nannocystis bainbridge TaxID=2995303 RepID=UPI0023EE9F4D|nr:alpha-1,4-glucan--maltose-1-phosphate maltosyltransferase [Nannocystis bainbridge]
MVPSLRLHPPRATRLPTSAVPSNAVRSPSRTPERIIIEAVSPALDDGRHAIKRVVGDTLVVEADIFKDGHDRLAAQVRWCGPDGAWHHTPLRYDYDSDRWFARIALDRTGAWAFAVEAWTDRFTTWRVELEKKFAAGQAIHSELLEGAVMVDAAARAAGQADRSLLMRLADELRDPERGPAERAVTAQNAELRALMALHLAPDDRTEFPRVFPVRVDRARARFGGWYEFFPRSCGEPGVHGRFADAERALYRVAAMGFDVVYLPPIHPIGLASRKGKNNSLTAEAGDVGSPWAIGGEAGGHTAVAPELGTLAEWDRFARTAKSLGLEIALDYALQCSPDHPWLKEHPEWFFVRPDGTIKYAENPPKKYQDIYPLDFWCEDREALWQACKDIVLFWVAHGVTIFRVDNPHTKALAFWEWLIAEVQQQHPDVLFLAEAFTRPKRMRWLAKAGFTQSYTYFTWRTTAEELKEYFTELTQGPMKEYYRGNFFINTPDILPEHLQRGGLPAFRIRLLLATTLAPTYGIYSGYELGENTPLRAGSEEYLDSEKYELRHRDYTVAGSLAAEITQLNRVRREHPALQRYDNLTFYPCDNPNILFYLKRAPGPVGDVLVTINCDWSQEQDGWVEVPLEALGIAADEPYLVEDLVSGARYEWRGSRNYVRLDPVTQPGHLFRLVRNYIDVEVT